MSERKNVVISPDGNELDVSDMDTSIQPFVESVCNEARGENRSQFSKTDYGHAAMNLACSAIAEAQLKSDPMKQKENLKELATEYVQKYGPQIIPKLRDELRFALFDED